MTSHNADGRNQANQVPDAIGNALGVRTHTGIGRLGLIAASHLPFTCS